MPAAGKFLALTFLVSMMPSVSALQLDCGPGAEAEEKTQHTLTCEGLQADGTVYWTKYDRNLGKITVATCDATGSCQTNFSTRYDVKRPNNVTSTLKILEVKRDETFVEGEWSCVSKSNETASCYVTVVFLPHVGECTMGFSEQSGQVAGRCEMHKVYPSPTCNWYEELEGQETDIPSNQTTLSLTQYVDSSTSQIYFRGECMLHRPLPVTAGSYSYKVLIIPGLVEPVVDFTTTNRVAVPAPPVLRNCPQDYVTDADANSCTCATSDLGSPQGSLAWYDPNNSTVLRNTSLILALPFSRVTAEFSGQTYRCGVVHHTVSPSVDYVPKIAASPNKPKLSGYDKNREYKVGETITLHCSADGGRPDITRVILQCDGRPDEADSHVGGSVISRLSFTLKESENNGECECYATNGVFTSERVTQRINDRVTSGKGYELEVWHVVLPVAVVFAVVILVSVVAYMIRKRKRSEPKKYDSRGLLSGSITTLDQDPDVGDSQSRPSGSPAPNKRTIKVEQEKICKQTSAADYSQAPSTKDECSHYEELVEVPSNDHVNDKTTQQGKEGGNQPIYQNQNLLAMETDRGHLKEFDNIRDGNIKLAEDSSDKATLAGDTDRPDTQTQTAAASPKLPSTAADADQVPKISPSSEQQKRQLSSGPSNFPSDADIDNSHKPGSQTSGRITTAYDGSTGSEGEAKPHTNKRSDSASEGQHDQSHHKDRCNSPTEVDRPSSVMKPEMLNSSPGSASLVPANKQPSLDPTEHTRTNQPGDNKNPASAAGSEHDETQVFESEIDDRTNSSSRDQADLKQANSGHSAPKQTRQPPDTDFYNKRLDSTAKGCEDAAGPEARGLTAPGTPLQEPRGQQTTEAMAGLSSTELHNDELAVNPDVGAVQSEVEITKTDNSILPKADSHRQPPYVSVIPSHAPRKPAKDTDSPDNKKRFGESPSQANKQETARSSLEQEDVQKERL